MIRLLFVLTFICSFAQADTMFYKIPDHGNRESSDLSIAPMDQDGNPQCPLVKEDQEYLALKQCYQDHFQSCEILSSSNFGDPNDRSFCRAQVSIRRSQPLEGTTVLGYHSLPLMADCVGIATRVEHLPDVITNKLKSPGQPQNSLCDDKLEQTKADKLRECLQQFKNCKVVFGSANKANNETTPSGQLFIPDKCVMYCRVNVIVIGANPILASPSNFSTVKQEAVRKAKLQEGSPPAGSGSPADAGSGHNGTR